jgi:hypothetical protein
VRASRTYVASRFASSIRQGSAALLTLVLIAMAAAAVVWWMLAVFVVAGVLDGIATVRVSLLCSRSKHVVLWYSSLVQVCTQP